MSKFSFVFILGPLFRPSVAALDKVRLDLGLSLEQGPHTEAVAVQKVRLLRDRLRRLRSRMRQPLAPKRVLLRDKLAFMLGVVVCMLSAYWLGMSPATFYKLYTYETAVLFGTRFILYRRKRWHYFMFDFCYWANLLLLLHLWYFPSSAVLHKITFAYASGPLAFSVIAFRNSLVFHSIDKFTSLFVHWFPAVIAWTERWHHPAHRGQPFRGKPGDLPPDWDSAGLTDLVLYPMALYLLWAGLYYAKIFVLSASRISERGYETLFKYVTQKGGALGRMLLKLPAPIQSVAYMALHLAFTAATCLLGMAWWHSYTAHTAFLLLVLAASAWNGAGYYFDYFALRYRKALGLSESRAPTPPLKAD
eukprot:jgi/Botrbrau1/20412/Bobra.0006s0068.2